MMNVGNKYLRWKTYLRNCELSISVYQHSSSTYTRSLNLLVDTIFQGLFYNNFLDRWFLIARKILNQEFWMVKFKSFLRNFYGRFYEWVESYRISGHRWRRTCSNGRYYYPNPRFSPSITYWIKLIVGFVLILRTTRRVSHFAMWIRICLPIKITWDHLQFMAEFALLSLIFCMICTPLSVCLVPF